MSEVKCKLCGLEPLTYEEEEEGYFHEKDVELAEGNYSSLKCVKNSAGRMCIYAVGDDCTEDYFPNFCPECGKKLTKDNVVGVPMNYRAAYYDLPNEIQQFESCITTVRSFGALIPMGNVADEIDKCITHSLSIGIGEGNEESN